MWSSIRSNSSNRSKRFERLEQLERFELASPKAYFSSTTRLRVCSTPISLEGMGLNYQKQL
jgi:hypothetical protein